MPTLRRILKYGPAVVLGLLVVAWLMSPFWIFGYCRQVDERLLSLDLAWGTVSFSSASRSNGEGAYSVANPNYQRTPAGRFELNSTNSYLQVSVPITWPITVVLAIAPFLSFRFRLWHYLAYTALVAVELAYYLRWPE